MEENLGFRKKNQTIKEGIEGLESECLLTGK